MPRMPTITQDDVNSICARLIGSGTMPSVRKIIEEHGSGSQGTIYPMFEKWRSTLERPADTATALSPALQRALLDFINKETSVAKAGLETQLGESKQIAADLARENERLANGIEEQSAVVSELRNGIAGLQGRVGQLDRDLAAAQEDAARVRIEGEKARTDLALALLRLEPMARLEAELKSMKAECETERRGRIVAEQAAAVAIAQKESLAERLAEEKARNETLIGERPGQT